ncbi:MAG: sulfurtransferase TusA family protein [Candidatus Bathyarchaeota archaeon]|nr:MAG: sulfurtransferase TusA family protein [Candidatus Bathyarchaeota archaeon]
MDDIVVENSDTVKVTLDCTGLFCPMPIVKMRKSMKELRPGERIRVLATDPGSMRDFKSWAEKTGNILLEASESDGVYTYVIEKKERS